MIKQSFKFRPVQRQLLIVLYRAHYCEIMLRKGKPSRRKKFITYLSSRCLGSPRSYNMTLTRMLKENLLIVDNQKFDESLPLFKFSKDKIRPVLKHLLPDTRRNLALGLEAGKFSLQGQVENSDTQQLNVSDSVSTRTAIVIISVIFLGSILALTYIYFKFPELEPEEKKFIKLPWDVDEAKQLGRVLEKHKDRNYYEVLAAVVVTYIFLQTFAIPGSISLSILSGFLFPFPLALTLVCFCSATGASFCYLLSHLAGRRLVYKYFPDRAVQYSQTVHKHRRNIFNYILFLRITPFLPNWFINIAAPIVNVPIIPFWFGTFLGVAPPSFVAIQAGQTLQQLTSMSGTWSWTSVTWLAAFSLLSLLPVLLRDRLRTKFD